MRYMVIIIAAFFLFFPATNLWGSAEDDFASGVKAYNAGDYEQALDIFGGLEDSGYVSPELYYNLGNSYYKSGLKGMAVASYMQAGRLAPRDEDTKANLRFVQGTLRDKVEDSLQNPIWRFAKESSLYFKANELTWIAFVIYLIIIVMLIYQVFYKQKNLAFLIILFFAVFLLIISGTMLGINLQLNYYTERGVITDPEVEILAGPGAISEVRFTAHEGLTFRILDQESGYYEGIFANKLKGWIEISKAYQF
ncbi:MAG: hypothetical protein GF310_01320 [candidate division Zixibacteria bacterium]|nr:hypothetical protein [candidate division Zixibacteria bacterium]